MAGTAFTRAVSPRLAECALTHLDRMPIDPAAAALQHESYEAALRTAGLGVIRLPALPEHRTECSSKTRRCCSTGMR
jgi:dimethylargininase